MLLAILLAAFAIAVWANDHSGRRDSDDHQHSGSDSGDHVVIEEDSDFTARVQAALNRNAPVLANSFSSERSQLRDEHRASAIAKRLQEVQAERSYRKSNVFSYQAVFSRNVAQECTASSGTITFTNGTASEPFDQSNQTICHARTAGPVIIIAKTTAADVTADSFDGNHDGIDDVQHAFNRLANNQVFVENHPKKNPTEEQLISHFLTAVRNRATVNGGSIGLKSLIVTGRQATKKAPFAVFGGVNNRILISPCFPVERSVSVADEGVARSRPFSDYNLEFVGIVHGFNGLFNVVPQVTYNTFVANAGNVSTQSDDQMLSQTGTFNLVMDAFPSPNNIGGTVQAGVIVGNVFFQKCTQFSYFS